MSQSSSWQTFCHFGAAACDGLLAARAASRDTQRPPSNEAEVPPTWRAPRQASTPPPPRNAQPTPPVYIPSPTSSPPQATTAAAPPT